MRAGQYKIIGVREDGTVAVRTHEGAPGDTWMCSFGKGVKAAFVIRYYPSKKGWRILDVRNTHIVTLPGNSRQVWAGMKRGDRYYATEDQAVMVAIHKAMINTRQPSML